MNIKKRGDLSIEELVKLILGALVLIAIIVLLVQLVKIAHSNVQAEQANNTMTRLAYEIQQLPKGSSKMFLVESPVDYFIWANNSRMCICPTPYLDQLKSVDDVKNEKLYALCSQSKFCLDNVNADMEEMSAFFAIGANTDYRCIAKKVPSVGGGYSVYDCVNIDKVPIALKLERAEDVVKITPVLDSSYRARMDELERLKKTIVDLKDGGATIFTFDTSVTSFKNVGWVLYANNPGYVNMICLCERPNGNFYSTYFDVCYKNGLCMNPGDSLTTTIKDNADKGSHITYFDIEKDKDATKEIATVVVQKFGNNVFISSKGYIGP